MNTESGTQDLAPHWKKESIDGSVLVLTYTNPDTNALTAEALREFSRILDATEGDAAVKCLVIVSGIEGHFLGDTDDVEWEAITTSQNPQSELVPWHRACSRLASYPVPTISAVDGKVEGAGLELMLCSDIRIAGPAARFHFSFLSRENIPYAGGTQRLPRILGKAKALELTLTGAVLDAKEAATCGLVQRAVNGAASEEAMKLARLVAAYDRRVVSSLKTAIAGSDVPLAEGLALESRLAASLMVSSRRLAGSETGVGDPS